MLLTKFWSDNIWGIDRLENLGKDVRRILKLIWKNVVKECGLDSCSSGQEPVSGYYTHSNKYCDLIKILNLFQATINIS